MEQQEQDTLKNLTRRSNMTRERERQLKIIDLFAGIGGIRMGFEQTKRVETVFSCEIDKNACKVYENNFGDNALCDITKLDPKDIPDFDILCGGFPCQAFSIAGARAGFDDARGTLFYDVARIVKEKKPKVVFLENVKGLTNHKGGKTFEVIRNTLEDLGYNVHWKVLNATKFGVPQKRERVYIVCLRKDIDNSDTFEFPTSRAQEKTIADILDKNVDAKYFLSQQYWNTLIAHKERHKDKGNGFGYQIIKHDEAANTIMCGGMGRERNLIIDRTKPKNLDDRKTKINTDNVRTMTPREWARLQGFPESFQLSSVNGHSYKQLGNCVVVPVIYQVAKRIVEKLSNG
jgi:DNA (cytosine-5)-methyltransferase 1